MAQALSIEEIKSMALFIVNLDQLVEKILKFCSNVLRVNLRTFLVGYGLPKPL